MLIDKAEPAAANHKELWRTLAATVPCGWQADKDEPTVANHKELWWTLAATVPCGWQQQAP